MTHFYMTEILGSIGHLDHREDAIWQFSLLPKVIRIPHVYFLTKVSNQYLKYPAGVSGWPHYGNSIGSCDGLREPLRAARQAEEALY